MMQPQKKVKKVDKETVKQIVKDKTAILNGGKIVTK